MAGGEARGRGNEEAGRRGKKGEGGKEGEAESRKCSWGEKGTGKKGKGRGGGEMCKWEIYRLDGWMDGWMEG